MNTSADVSHLYMPDQKLRMMADMMGVEFIPAYIPDTKVFTYICIDADGDEIAKSVTECRVRT